MNVFEKFIDFLNNIRMEEPNLYGWFHLMWIGIIVLTVFLAFKYKNRYNEKQLKLALGLYGIITFILELTKQIMQSLDVVNGQTVWSFTWYSAPFQLCTTPMFVALIALFLKKGKFRDALLSYLSFYIVVTSFMVVLMPTTVFSSRVLINVHTMYLHCMSLSLAIYLLINHEVAIKKENLLNAFKVFISFVMIALYLDIVFYNSGILDGQTFNMFYISPYFPCELPVFSIIYNKVPYLIFLLLYILIIFGGSCITYFVMKSIENRKKRSKNEKNIKKRE